MIFLRYHKVLSSSEIASLAAPLSTLPRQSSNTYQIHFQVLCTEHVLTLGPRYFPLDTHAMDTHYRPSHCQSIL